MGKKKTTAKEGQAKRGPGRPKGSKNKPKPPVVEHHPPACPKCSCTETEDGGVRTRKSIRIGEFSVHWRSLKCKACGLKWIRRTKRKPALTDAQNEKNPLLPDNPTKKKPASG